MISSLSFKLVTMIHFWWFHLFIFKLVTIGFQISKTIYAYTGLILHINDALHAYAAKTLSITKCVLTMIESLDTYNVDPKGSSAVNLSRSKSSTESTGASLLIVNINVSFQTGLLPASGQGFQRINKKQTFMVSVYAGSHILLDCYMR